MNVPGFLLFVHLCAVVDVTVSSPATCRNPPPLAHGDTVANIKVQYVENDRVPYICQTYFTMEGGPYKTCINGEWTGEIRCLQPCTVEREVLDSHNIEFKYSNQDKIYARHNDMITFKCKLGMRNMGSMAMRPRCVDGVIEMPTCSG